MNVAHALYGSEKILKMYHKEDQDGVLVKSGIDDQVLIHYSVGRIQMFFRGTNNPAQWASNFDDLAKPVKLGSGIQMHPGAYQSFTGLRDGVHSTLMSLKASLAEDAIPIDVWDHSRGHFLAAECIRILGSEFNFCNWDSMGGPKVGNKEYNAAVSRYVNGVTQRWVNNNDFVTYVARPFAGYTHSDWCYYIDRRGKVHKHFGTPLFWFDKVLGRGRSALKLRLKDGTDDHRLQTGYIPAFRKLLNT